MLMMSIKLLPGGLQTESNSISPKYYLVSSPDWKIQENITDAHVYRLTPHSIVQLILSKEVKFIYEMYMRYRAYLPQSESSQ